QSGHARGVAGVFRASTTKIYRSLTIAGRPLEPCRHRCRQETIMMLRRSTVPMAFMRSLGLALIVAFSAVGATVVGQQPSRSPQRQPLLDEKGYVREEAYIPGPLPESERGYAKIAGAHMEALVNEVVEIS